MSNQPETEFTQPCLHHLESLEQLIAKKRLIKKGVMQELLTGKRRLLGFTKPWANFTLRDCLLSSPDYGINAPGVLRDLNLPTYLRITDIDEDGCLIEESLASVNHPVSRNYLLSNDEIVFARTGASVGKTFLYDNEYGELVFAGFLIRARIDRKKLAPEFFNYFTHTQKYWNWVRVMSMRSGQPGINGNEYASLTFDAPSDISEQKAISSLLIDIDNEIRALIRELAKTRIIKQGMMQQLLTGKIRLI